MPHFTVPISAQGPVVDAAIMVSAARQSALHHANLQVPAPQIVRALIDTGASMSGVDPSVLVALGLSPTGEADIHTPSTGGIPVSTPTYDVRIAIVSGRSGDSHFVSETIQVVSTELTAQGLQVLIGTDILESFILHYNGAEKVFSLCY